MEIRTKPLILIAEDTESNYQYLAVFLRKNYELIRAVNGEEAISRYKDHSLDLILMDTKMPLMDGLEATREIRKIDREIPIIAQTANAYDTDREKALEAGCNDYIAKPFHFSKLLDLIQSHLG